MKMWGVSVEECRDLMIGADASDKAAECQRKLNAKCNMK